MTKIHKCIVSGAFVGLWALCLSGCGRTFDHKRQHAGLKSTGTEIFCNGQVSHDHSGTYYPNGQKVSDSWGLYYPNGHKIFDSWGLYYDQGKKIHDSWGTYYASGRKVFDSWGVYYPNGQKVKDSWGCYFANGQRMGACPERVIARYQASETGSLLKHSVHVDTGAIGDIDAEWVMGDGTHILLTLKVDLIADEASVTNIQAICDGN